MSRDDAKKAIDDFLSQIIELGRKHLEPPGSESPGGSKRSPLIPPHCIYERCGRPHAGPRFAFFCREHADLLSPKRRSELLKAYRGPRVPRRGKN